MSDQERRQRWMEVRRRIKAPLYPDWPEALPIKYVVLLKLERHPNVGWDRKALRDLLEWAVVKAEKLPVQIRPDGKVIYGTFSEFQHHQPDSASVQLDDLMVTAESVYEVLKDTCIEGDLRTWLEPYLRATTSSAPESTPSVSAPELIAQAPEKPVVISVQPRVTRTEKAKKDHLRELVSEIARRASAAGHSFDTENAPGDLQDLHWLACLWRPAIFQEMKKWESLRNHTGGVIKWSNTAGQNDPAKAFYLGLFPELQADVGQVKVRTGSDRSN